MYNQIYSISSEFVKSLKADKNYFFLNESGVHFIDSIPVSTCLNRRIFSHKVISGLASRGKSSKGWFYGFKPHGVCSEKGVLESVVFTSGNINDSKMVERVTENMKGWFYRDAGYLKKCGELARLAESGRFICAAARRRNMNRIVSNGQWRLLRKRNIIESDRGSPETELLSRISSGPLNARYIPSLLL